jgi:sRNA-binding regulator protein Hfq
MSLSDYMKMLRARQGGVTPLEIQEVTGIPVHEINYIEMKHRRIGDDDEMLARLAAYFKVPLEQLQWHRERYRKRLTAVLYQRQDSGDPITLKLESGHELSGAVNWFDRSVVALSQEGAETIVVERHAVLDWE